MIQTDKRTQRGWVFYDWANSAYTLVVGTAVYPIYYGSVVKSAEITKFTFSNGLTLSPTAAYTFSIAAAFLVVSLVAPYLAALSEVSGNKRSYMRGFMYMGALACISMFFFTESTVWLGLVAPFVASLSFSGSLVFYNSYLPEIALPEDQDSLSARGFSMGYFGSSFLLIAVLTAIQNPDWIDPSATVGLVTRWCFVVVGLWWILFGEYSMARLPKGAPHALNAVQKHPSTAYRTLYLVIVDLFKDKAIRLFVAAFFFASAGVQTVILIASLFGSQALGLPTSALITTILLIQYVAMLGAWGFAKLSKVWGNIPTLIVAAVGWAVVCVLAYFVQNTLQFYLMGAGVGLVMGGIQSLSRSTFSKLLPEREEHVTYFSFYDIAEKLATVLGMVSVGWLENATGNLRLSALMLVAYFVIAIVFWLRIPKSVSARFLESRITA